MPPYRYDYGLDIVVFVDFIQSDTLYRVNDDTAFVCPDVVGLKGPEFRPDNLPMENAGKDFVHGSLYLRRDCQNFYRD
jgi:hypothetical protein